MELGLRGKHALVTGGSHGLGLATAQALADEGCSVAICARSEERMAPALASLATRGVATLGIRGDVTIAADVDRVVSTVIDAWGTLHILVNNVGGGGRWGEATVEDTKDEVWSEVYMVNAMAAVRFTRLVIPFMRRQKWGRVVTVSSIYGREGGARPWYAMAKSAEISLMKSLSQRRELVRDGITFNTIAPGAVMIPDTGFHRERTVNPGGFAAWVDANFPLSRLGEPEEVASLVVFTCSERASLINGACLTIDGGEGRSL